MSNNKRYCSKQYEWLKKKWIITKTGYKHSEETKQKISKTKLSQNLKLTEEHKRKISEGNIGKHKENKSEETKQKISNTLTGKIQSEETKQKRSKSMQGKNKGSKSWISLGEITKRISPEDIDKWLEKGWTLGRFIPENFYTKKKELNEK